MDMKLIFTVATLHSLALITPGPDFILAIRNTLQFGRYKGFATALGFGLGIAVHVTYSLLGMALLLKKFPDVYHYIRYAGASYLIYLGITALWGTFKKTHQNELVIEPQGDQGLGTSFQQGLLTNILNPKATLFILGIYTSAIPPGTSQTTLIAAGLMMVCLTVVWFSVVAFLFSSKTVRGIYLRLEGFLNGLFAIFFMLAGIGLFISN